MDTRAEEKPADPAPPTPPAKTSPEPPARKATPRDDRPRPNGDGQNADEASEKQINAIFAIGRSKGYSSDDIKDRVKERFGKSVNALSTPEASKLIDNLRVC